MADKGRSPRSIQSALTAIRRVYNVTKKFDAFAGDNPVSKIKIPKMDSRRMRFLEESEAELLLEWLVERHGQLYVISLLSLYWGCEPGRSLVWRGGI